ncbi:MAG: methionyl-tRNA formyltransferase, partial [Mahellales bacterium]
MKVVFMGSPDFAVPCLDMLIREHNVVAVVTQPDRPKGRGKKMAATPVKDRALSGGIPVLQPISVKEPKVADQIRALAPDVIITAAYGQIIPPAILDIPRYGCINVHASLLPKYRGASPIQWCIINGEEETGITIMYMEEGMDTGDILLKRRLSIGRDETAGQLHDRLSCLAVEALKTAMEGIQTGTITPIPQDHSKATYCPKLDKSMGIIDWTKDARAIKNLVRGLNPWPGAYTYYKNDLVKIWNVNI